MIEEMQAMTWVDGLVMSIFTVGVPLLVLWAGLRIAKWSLARSIGCRSREIHLVMIRRPEPLSDADVDDLLDDSEPV